MSNPNMEAKVKELLELKRMKEQLEVEISSMEDEIKAVMGDEETMLAGVFKVTWTAYTSSRFDSARFRKEHAELTAKHVKPLPVGASVDVIAEGIVADYICRSNVRLKHTEGDRDFYRPSDDSIFLPLREQFRSTAEYYSTVYHEMVHSTGHKSRLDRLDHVAAFGSEDYSKEELIAEIGAAALVNQASLETASSFRNSAAYIQNWLSVLRNDKRFIVSAAGKAEKAVKLILNHISE